MPADDHNGTLPAGQTLDASSISPPSLVHNAFQTSDGTFLPGNIFLDRVGVVHWSTSPNAATWPSGAIWPPFPANPLQDYWTLMPFAEGSYAMPEAAWATIRRLPNVWCHIISGPRTSINFGVKYEQLLYLPGWNRGPTTSIPVIHHQPVADAGSARIWDTSTPGPDRLQEDLRLDASRSHDPDGGTLTFSWTLRSAPAGATALPWRPLLGANVLALPAGTEIPDNAIGPYTFELTVANPYGTSTATVTHSLQPVNSAPVADAGPDRIIRVLKGGRLKEALTADASASHDPDGDPLLYTWRMFCLPGNSGDLLLPAPATLAEPILPIAVAGQKLAQNTCVSFGLEVAVADASGATASDTSSVYLELIRPTIKLGDHDSTAIALEELQESGLNLPVSIQRPSDPDLIEPDSWELEIFDRSSSPKVSLGTRPITSAEIDTGTVSWDGLYPSSILTPPQAGQFTLRLRAFTEEIFYVVSNEVDVDIVHLEISFRGNVLVPSFTGPDLSPGSQPFPSIPKPPTFPPFPVPGGSGKRSEGSSEPLGSKNPLPGLGGGGGLPLPSYSGKAWPIEWAPPSMPDLRVNASVLGATPIEAAKLEIEIRIKFEWGDPQNRQRGQIPADGGWTKLAAGESQWMPTFDTLIGGDLTVEARAAYKNIKLNVVERSKTPVLGRNPDPVESRLRIGGPAYQAWAYEQSRFRNFGSETPAASGDLVLAEPYQRNGRCGLTGLADATPEQSWNWQANVDEFVRRAILAQTAALDHETAAVLSGSGSAAAMSAEQFELETWTRLGDPEASYHQFDKLSEQWLPASASNTAIHHRQRADRLSFLLATVRAGQAPEDWQTSPGPNLGFAATTTTSAENAIRTLFVGGGDPLDSAVTAAYGILSPLSWWDLHTTLDGLAGHGGGPSSNGILDLLAMGAADQQHDARVVAAIEATRLRRGFHTLTDADLPSLRRFVDALLACSPTNQYLVLRSLGLTDLTTEGIVVTATSGDDYPSGESISRTSKVHADIGVAAASGTVPFGTWNKPGNMPEPFYVGDSVHRAIAARYTTVHAPEAGFIATNVTPISTIVSKLADLYGFDPGHLTDTLGKPDIFEVSVNHFPPVIVYEIKPRGSELLAEAEALGYCAALFNLSVPAGLGPQYLNGTGGIVPAPDGWAEFNTPTAGVITYRYFKAPPAAVKARNEQEGREERRSTIIQRILVAIQWGLTAALVAALILLALEAAGFVLIIAVLGFA